MKKYHYTVERNVQILLYLLKAHNIRKIVASPGTTNITFIASAQQDPFFEIYSCVDERSAAYIACGLAEESGEAVVISCTGATASRNYIPALTEAFYRKIPVLAVTATQEISKIGNMVPQVIDRRQQLNDIVKISEHIGVVTDRISEDDAALKINRVILELFHHGKGPAHINLTTTYSRDYSVEKLPKARVINRFLYDSILPEMGKKCRVAIFIGAHSTFNQSLTEAVDAFCRIHDAVVFCDHTSGYHGAFRVPFSIVNSQDQIYSQMNIIDVLIHIGEISGDYPEMKLNPKEVWRVSEDGCLRDLFHSLKYVFEMSEQVFFNHYSQGLIDDNGCFFLEECISEVENVRNNIPELPFSNVWIAQNTAGKIPDNSVLHLGILNTLRCWNMFDINPSVQVASNTGGFGIDGGLSALIGASLARPNVLHFMVIGDLSLFYDMNVLGNRHIGKNVRILLINNGKGTEFRMYSHPGFQFGDQTDEFIAAGRHFGNKSNFLVKHFAEDLGFDYLTASDKDTYLKNVTLFLNGNSIDKPVIFEVFTESELESQALQMICNIVVKPEEPISNTMKVKGAIKKVLGNKGVEIVKKAKEIIS